MSISEEHLFEELNKMSVDKIASIFTKLFIKRHPAEERFSLIVKENILSIFGSKNQKILADHIRVANGNNSKLVLDFAESVELNDIDVIRDMQSALAIVSKNYGYVIKNLTSLPQEKRKEALEVVSEMSDQLNGVRATASKIRGISSIIFNGKRKKALEFRKRKLEKEKTRPVPEKSKNKSVKNKDEVSQDDALAKKQELKIAKRKEKLKAKRKEKKKAIREAKANRQDPINENTDGVMMNDINTVPVIEDINLSVEEAKIEESGEIKSTDKKTDATKKTTTRKKAIDTKEESVAVEI